mmetsp:Transcript_4892/g.10799  ORF Transcript_4892/g.10799 Transcript_4892/m.10799 type:complete len:83 (-) Transcript_4892:1310-1558(-)
MIASFSSMHLFKSIDGDAIVNLPQMTPWSSDMLRMQTQLLTCKPKDRSSECHLERLALLPPLLFLVDRRLLPAHHKHEQTLS